MTSSSEFSLTQHKLGYAQLRRIDVGQAVSATRVEMAILDSFDGHFMRSPIF